MTEQDRDFAAECIRWLEERGYKVSKARKPRSAQLKGTKLLDAHRMHRDTGAVDLDTCRLCRFRAAAVAHRAHVADVAGCWGCVDRSTRYLYGSVMRSDGPRDVPGLVRDYYARSAA